MAKLVTVYGSLEAVFTYGESASAESILLSRYRLQRSPLGKRLRLEYFTVGWTVASEPERGSGSLH